MIVMAKPTITELVEKVVDLAQQDPTRRAHRPEVYERHAPHVYGGHHNTMLAELLDLGAALEQSYHWNTSRTGELLTSFQYRIVTPGDRARVEWLDRVLQGEDVGMSRRDAVNAAGLVPR